MDRLAQFAGFEVPAFLIICLAVFVAGLVRGFAGFGLSAVVMAAIAVKVPPVQLIPICFVLEGAASIAMFRGGIRDADHPLTLKLAVMSAIGVPLSLYLTIEIEASSSQFIALCLVLGLTLMQVFKLTPSVLQKPIGPYLAGFVAGIATGFASIGGMVIALFVLAQGTAARQMRGSLVMFLFISMFTSLVTQSAMGVLDVTAWKRGLVLTPIVLFGVFLGAWAFQDKYQQYYKRFCLGLLIVLSLVGLIQLI